MYSVSSYGRMIADAPRIDAYVTALRRAVKPNSVVVDLGCGPGLFAMLACQMGARRVYAIDPDNVIEVARQAAVVNGFGDRIEFIQDYSTRVTLPEKADVIISDLRGVLPWFYQHIPAVIDARQRLLKTGGVLIPQKDVLWAALVDAPEQYAKISGPWEQNPYGLDLNSARRFVINSWQKHRVEPEQFVTEPLELCVLDYREIEDHDIDATLRWDSSHGGTAHGFAVWFDSELSDGIGFSNRPGEVELIYGNAFFPFSEPVHLRADDRIQIQIMADLIEADYVWRWKTQVWSRDAAEPRVDFKQSSFFAAPLSSKQLQKRAHNFMPNLSEEGRATAEALSLMDGQASLQQIAERLAKDFPERYKSTDAALNDAAELSLKYSNE
jgi:type I protein arginine methyltransferase